MALFTRSDFFSVNINALGFLTMALFRRLENLRVDINALEKF
jgi:hypothetical protein